MKYLTNGACEKAGVLQDDGDLGAEVVKTELRNVAAIDHDLAVSGLEDPE
jgi:hypothetical protein